MSAILKWIICKEYRDFQIECFILPGEGLSDGIYWPKWSRKNY